MESVHNKIEINFASFAMEYFNSRLINISSYKCHTILNRWFIEIRTHKQINVIPS